MSSGLQVITWTIGTLVAIVGAYFAYRQIQPRPALTIYRTETPLITRHELAGVTEQLTIEHAGLGKLHTPTLVRVIIENSGRADVASPHFDGAVPLRLDLGTPILERLEAVSNRPAQTLPPVTVDSTGLLIGPGLISRGQSLEYPCLVDGEVVLRVTHALANVDLDGRSATMDHRPLYWQFALMVSASLNVTLAIVIGALVNTVGWFPPKAEENFTVPVIAQLVLGFCGLTLVVTLAGLWSYERKQRRKQIGL
jgi:hypothetical protein